MAQASKYRLTLETLRKEILSGKYTSNKAFPSLVTAGRRFGISRLTAVKVFDKLKDEGLIDSRVGSGTFVTDSARSRLIGLVIPGISYSSEFFQPIVSETIRLAREHDYTILMEGVWSPDADENGKEAIEVAARLIRRKVAGVIYQPLEYSSDSEAINRRVLEAFARADIPVVLLDGDIVAGPARSEYDLVSIDNEGAGEALAAHLLDCGANNICFFMRRNWVQNVLNRARGVRNAVLARGGKWRSSNVVMGNPDDAEAIRKILRRRPRVDAFVCENDILAALLMKTLFRLGLRVPDDVQVTGFDDVRLARLTTPALTTVRQPCAAIARVAFERLLGRAQKGRSALSQPLHLQLPYTLEIRSSTRGS